jgi:Cu+-exporting ATPase
MKKQLLVFVCMLVACSSLYAKDDKKKKETVTFFIEEIDCGHCIKKIEKNISFEKGVTDLKTDLKKRTATVTYKTSKTNKTKLTAAFKKIDMTAVPVDENAGCNVQKPAPTTKKAEHKQ